ncbi:MAG: hypothetical protein ACR2NN_06815 [Bryobacteraceae bacterium]
MSRSSQPSKQAAQVKKRTIHGIEVTIVDVSGAWVGQWPRPNR